MKKILVLLIVVFISITLSGCNNQNTAITMMSYELNEYEVNDYSDASMVISDESISSKGLLLEFNYYGEDEGTTGTWYTIFLYEDNEWNELSYITDEEVVWAMIASIVEKNQDSQMSINWEWLYGELSTGRYLIVKQFMNRRGPGDFDEYYLACEFTI